MSLAMGRAGKIFITFALTAFLILAVCANEVTAASGNSTTSSVSTPAPSTPAANNTTVIAEKPKDEENRVDGTEDKKTSQEIKKSICDVCNCTETDIDCSNRQLNSTLLDHSWPNKTWNLVDFSNNSITKVDKFSAVSITILNLSGNRIRGIDNAAFKDIQNFTELNLGYNALTSEDLIPSVFAGNYVDNAFEPLSIKTLNLEENLFHTIHKNTFEHLPYLEYLNLRHNPLKDISHPVITALSDLTQLRRLNLSDCELTHIERSALSTSRHLKDLDLSYNEFKVLPDTLKRLEWLDKLIISHNPIESLNFENSFPPMIIRELTLSNMEKLTYIGKGALANLKFLETLKIENCPNLANIHEDALLRLENNSTAYPPLKKLLLSNNNLTTLSVKLIAPTKERLANLSLANNPIDCSCRNREFLLFLLNNQAMWKSEHDLVKCATPAKLKNSTLLSKSHEIFSCKNFDMLDPPRSAIFHGFMIGLMLGIPATVIFFLLWKRGYFFCRPSGPGSFSRAFYKRAPVSYIDVDY